MVATRLRFLLVVVLVATTIVCTLPPVYSPPLARILIDASHLNVHTGSPELEPFFAMLESWTVVPPCHASPVCRWGYEAVIAAAGLNSSILSGIDVYVASMPATPYSVGEVDALVSWFGSGGKSVWLASDSDFTTAGSVDGPIHQNALLEALGSKLRFEPSSVESSTLNIGGTPYSVLTPIINRETEAAILTQNVRMGFFHGPTILAGYNGGNHVALETTSLENVVWLAKTATDSVLVETDLTHPPYAHTEGQHGPFVIAAAETVGTSRIIATGEAIFTNYKSMISYPGEQNTPQDDGQLVINAFSWFVPTLANTALKVTAPASVIQGEFSTFLAEYTTFGHTAENLTTFETADVPNAMLSGSVDGTPLHFITVGCDPACAICASAALGTFSWRVSASAESFKPQTATGILTVVPGQATTTTTITLSPTPAPLTPIVATALSLSLPCVLFTARHHRRRRKHGLGRDDLHALKPCSTQVDG